MIKADNHCITFKEGQISIFEDCPIVSTDWRATCMQTFDYSRSWLHRILFLSWLRKKQGCYVGQRCRTSAGPTGQLSKPTHFKSDITF